MWLNRKQMADIITAGRLLFGVAFVWLGVTRGAAGLPLAGLLLVANWTADSIDGPLARSHPTPYRTWLGDHDLEVDMLITAGILVYLATAGLAPALWAASYLVVWLAAIHTVSNAHALGALVQVPVQAWLLITLLREVSQAIWWVLGWAGIGALVRGRYFVGQRLPEFFRGLGEVWRRQRE